HPREHSWEQEATRRDSGVTQPGPVPNGRQRAAPVPRGKVPGTGAGGVVFSDSKLISLSRMAGIPADDSGGAGLLFFLAAGFNARASVSPWSPPATRNAQSRSRWADGGVRSLHELDAGAARSNHAGLTGGGEQRATDGGPSQCDPPGFYGRYLSCLVSRDRSGLPGGEAADRLRPFVTT